jgi:hypothetical protein
MPARKNAGSGRQGGRRIMRRARHRIRNHSTTPRFNEAQFKAFAPLTKTRCGDNIDSPPPIGNFADTWLFEPAGLPPRKIKR